MDTRPAIAVFLPSINAGGAEHVMLELAAGFASHGLRVDFVVGSANGVYRDRIPGTVTVFDFGVERTAAAFPHLVRYLRARRPTVLLSTMNHVNVVVAASALLAHTGVRLVVREATTPTAQARQTPGFRAAMVTRLMPIAYRSAAAIVAVSERSASDTAALIGVPRDRIHAIGNPVDVDDLRRQALAPAGHPWLDVPGGPPVIVSVGRLDYVKDFPTLIRAFARVLAQRPARLVIAGEGSERASLESLIDELGIAHSVSLRGFARNPHALLARSAVFVLASRWEGLPNALLHALALEVPAVATDCAGGSGEVLGYGTRGSLVPVGDDRAMAEAILKALSGPRRVSHEDFVRAEYAPDRIIAKYLDVMGLAGTA